MDELVPPFFARGTLLVAHTKEYRISGFTTKAGANPKPNVLETALRESIRRGRGDDSAKEAAASAKTLTELVGAFVEIRNRPHQGWWSKVIGRRRRV